MRNPSGRSEVPDRCVRPAFPRERSRSARIAGGGCPVPHRDVSTARMSRTPTSSGDVGVVAVPPRTRRRPRSYDLGSLSFGPLLTDCSLGGRDQLGNGLKRIAADYVAAARAGGPHVERDRPSLGRSPPSLHTSVSVRRATRTDLPTPWEGVRRPFSGSVSRPRTRRLSLSVGVVVDDARPDHKGARDDHRGRRPARAARSASRRSARDEPSGRHSRATPAANVRALPTPLCGRPHPSPGSDRRVVGVRRLPVEPRSRPEPAGTLVLSFEWDALRSGDLVSVHDDDDVGGQPLPGVVAMVDWAWRRRGSSDVGIRTTELDGTQRVRRPARLATHLHGEGRVAGCWRCAAMRGDA